MDEYPAITIETLEVEPDRPDHIARHGVTVEEVQEVITGDYIAVPTREDRYLVVGTTSRGRFLAVVVGQRPQPGTYGLVTARPAHRTERALYNRFIDGDPSNA